MIEEKNRSLQQITQYKRNSIKRLTTHLPRYFTNFFVKTMETTNYLIIMYVLWPVNPKRYPKYSPQGPIYSLKGLAL